MTPKENLYYALGELAYAVAKADGLVQWEEKKKFLDMVVELSKAGEAGFDISAIIFQVMTKDKASLPDSYHWAIHEIKQNSHYLSPEMKQDFISVMKRVAKAYPPVTVEESDLIDQFVRDVEPIIGDPSYYNN